MNAPTTFLGNELRANRHAENPIIRAAFAIYAAKAAKQKSYRVDVQPAEVLRDLWPADDVAQGIVAKADASPQTTGGHGSITGTSVADFFAGVPNSAGARLIAAGMKISLDGESTATLPHRTGGPALAPWVAEGAPIPATDWALAAVTLGPVRKAAMLTVFSGELARRAASQEVFRKLFLEDAAATIDAAIFNANAATSAAPAGLLAGVTPIVGMPGGDAEAVTTDFKAALAPYFAAGGSTNIAVVCRPAQAVALALAMPLLPWPVWPSPQVAAGRVIIVDQSGFVSAFGSGVEIDAAKDATVHMEDTTPLEIVAGTPTTADPVRSFYQTDTIALRMMVDLAFGMRGAGLVQVINGVSW